jgi:SAM-dependent methyltransferase
MREIHIQSLMRELYSSLEYYASVEPEAGVGFEEEYHHVTRDPDGRERNLLSEREHSLASTREITDYLAGMAPGRILDVGCGLGWILSSLDVGWEKHGIEISKFASNHASQFGTIHTGTLEDFRGSSFDVVLMNHVIEHLPDPIGALDRVHGLLREGGVLILGTPDFDSGAARRYGERFRLLHDPTHISLFSCDSMHRCLRDRGFKIRQVEYPFFDTAWFSKENLLRMLEDATISPPFYGSAMTFFCERI